MSVNFQEIKQKHNIVDVVSQTVSLRKQGAEMIGICPFHDDKHESLKVNNSKQLFSCFACGAAGDVFDFHKAFGMSSLEAADKLEGKDVNGNFHPIQNQVKTPIPKVEKWDYISTPDSLPTSFLHYLHGEPSKTWAYKNASGAVVGYVCRFDIAEGEKEVLPFTFATNGTRREWRWKGIPNDRPLYNLDLLTANPNAAVLIVEGEKTADAAQNELDPAKTVAVTWIGGANGIVRTDFGPLAGRNILLLPDNDFAQTYGDKHPKAGELKPYHEQPGNAAMLAISEILKPVCDVRRWVTVPDGLPNKWDVADKEWTPGELIEFIRENLSDLPEVEIESEKPTFEAPIVQMTPLAKIEPEQIAERGTYKNPPPPVAPDEPMDAIFENQHFRLLGYGSDENSKLEYYFFSHAAKTVVKLNPSSMSKSNLMQIAPINFWESAFPGAKSKIDIDAGQQFLIGNSHNIGIFNPKCIRGRGAWIEDGKVLIHTGKQLLIEGKKIPLKEYRSKYVYQVGEELGFGHAEPLQTKEASKIFDSVKWLNFEREIDSYLLAGWCVIAPFCGVLNWRPHIWVTGPAGTGKTWVMENMVRRLMGETAIAVQGKTTEAGVRGLLQSDARPVLIDEADVDNHADKERIQGILAFARAASSSDGGEIAKGTQSGGSRTFVTRSCFAFSSIGVQLNQQSDRSRFSTFSLKAFEGEDSENEFAKFHREWDEMVDEDFVQKLQARTMELIPVILENAKTFSKAASHEIKSQRTGDQVGAMIAGVFSLFSKNLISYDDAVKWIKARDWSEEKGVKLTRDELQLFSVITGKMVRVEGELSNLERSVGELILISANIHHDYKMHPDAATDRLRRMGIVIEDENVYISNTAPGVREIVSQTSWGSNHGEILKRLDGAEADSIRHYYPGHKSRGTKIPLVLFSEGYKVTPKPTPPDMNPNYTSAANPTMQQKGFGF